MPPRPGSSTGSSPWWRFSASGPASRSRIATSSSKSAASFAPAQSLSAQTSKSDHQGVLLPGLWMPGAAMLLLAARLSRRGYAPRIFAYRGRSPLDANVERLVRFVRESLGGRPAHCVGHSLGGILVLETLNRNPHIAAASATLIGAPVRGCFAGRRLGTAGVGRGMVGARRPAWR